MKTAIVGFGNVGQAMYHIIKDKGVVSIYDKNLRHYSEPKVLLGSEIVFICLPTPNHPSGEQDVSAFIDFFEYIEEVQHNEASEWHPIFVIKSTILFDNLAPYLDKFRIVMNPEFLNQNSAFSDSQNQKIVILGGHIDLLDKVEKFYVEQTCVEATYEYMSIKEAIDFKYIRNIYGAYKVLFWNWVQEQTGDARKMAELYNKLPQGEMSTVAADGKPGYGGACFVKDVAARHNEFPHELTAFMQNYNGRLRQIDKKMFLTPKLMKG